MKARSLSVGRQINCDTGAHNHYFKYAHMCTQYADKCPPEFITNWTTPLQQQSIQDFIDAGVPQVSAAAWKRILSLRCAVTPMALLRCVVT